ncbi:hypothetical protein Droror1_Dr00006700 [Drosera rotundifolia]
MEPCLYYCLMPFLVRRDAVIRPRREPVLFMARLRRVIVALIRARVVEAEYKHGISQVTEQYSSAFNSSVIELHLAASRAQKANNNEDEDEDEFLTARSSASYCSSSADTEAFFSVKTIFSCSDVNSEYLAELLYTCVYFFFGHFLITSVSLFLSVDSLAIKALFFLIVLF